MQLESLVQIFGGAGATFYVMWLWLKSVQEEKKLLQDKLESVEEKRITELREMLPLLTDASKGLQEVIKSNLESNTEVVSNIKSHIDEKTNELTEKCKKK
jgi:homoserine dehydrogenase